MPAIEPREVVRLGISGEGMIEAPSGPLFIPGALPGECVTQVDSRGWTLVSANSPQRRVIALCPHVARCGGCSVQHMSDDLYHAWKETLLPEALRTQGIATRINSMISVPRRSRRRAVLSVRRDKRNAVIGFHGLRSQAIEPIAECAVLSPAIVTQLPVLRALTEILVSPESEARIAVAATPHGLDVDFDSTGMALGPDVKLAVSRLVTQSGIVRLSMRGDALIVRAEPALLVAGVDVVPLPGAFFQAVGEAETAMQDLAVAGAGKAKRVADLFCGIGTFAIALARRARVLAVDGDRDLLAALRNAQNRAQGLKPIETKVRDLFSDPMSPKELEGFDAVLFDPPRAGAKAQAAALSRSKVKTVIAVSCNVATLARDLRTLVDGGYRIDSITPIDQFLFTPHLEAVAVLHR